MTKVYDLRDDDRPPSGMDATEFRQALARLETNIERFGRAMGVHKRTSQRWGIEGPSPPVEAFLRLCLGLGLKWYDVEPHLEKNASPD